MAGSSPPARALAALLSLDKPFWLCPFFPALLLGLRGPRPEASGGKEFISPQTSAAVCHESPVGPHFHQTYLILKAVFCTEGPLKWQSHHPGLCHPSCVLSGVECSQPRMHACEANPQIQFRTGCRSRGRKPDCAAQRDIGRKHSSELTPHT